VESCGPYKIVSETGSGDGWTSYLARGDGDEVLITVFADEALARRIVELQQRAASASSCVAPVVQSGSCEEGGWYATRAYPRNLAKLLEGRVELSQAWLLAVLLATTRGALALKRACGRSHGALRPHNILLSGTTNLKEAEIVIKDPLGEDSSAADLELRDLKAIGMVLYQLVRRREVEERSMILPLELSPEWKGRFGKQADRWVSLCNRLLDPGLSLDQYALEQLERELIGLEPRAPVSRKQLVAALIVVLCAGAATLVVGWFRSRATLQVTSNLPGATVTVSSEGTVAIEAQRLPLSLKVRKGKTYRVEGKRGDFSTTNDVLVTARKQSVPLHFQYGVLNITAFEEGTTRQLFSTNIYVAPDVQVKYPIVVKDYQPDKVEETLRAGETTNLVRYLKRTLPGQVKIRIEARPITAWLEIRDGRNAVVAGPDTGEVNKDLSPGQYKVVLRYIVSGQEVTAVTTNIVVDASSPRERKFEIPTRTLDLAAQDAATGVSIDNATIWWGTNQIGRTADLPKVLWPVGTWDFELRADGYETVNVKGLALRKDAPSRQPVKLTRILAEVAVRSDPPTGVRFGTNPAQLSSESPAAILLPPGPHTLYARHDDLGWVTNQLMLVRGKTNADLVFGYGRVTLTANLSDVMVSVSPLNRRVELRPESTLVLPPGNYSFEALYAKAQPPLATNITAKVDLQHKEQPLPVHFNFAFAKVIFVSTPDLGADVYDERPVWMGTAHGTNEMIVPAGKRTYYFVRATDKGDKKTNTVVRELASMGPHRIESDFSKPANFVTPFGEFVWLEHMAGYVGISEVTQSQYEKVMGNNPSVGLRNANHPVNYVTYNQALQFCKQLQTTAPPPPGFYYNLPTEPQWMAFAGDALTNPDLAVTKATNAGATNSAPVRSKGPNQYGLYDVCGNLYEWILQARDPIGSAYSSLRLWAPKDIFFRWRVPEGGIHPDKYTGFRVILMPRPSQSVASGGAVAPQTP
jgi:hypothetical protein